MHLARSLALALSGVSVLLLLSAPRPASAQNAAPPAQVRIRGVIESFNGTTLMVRAQGQTFSVTVPPEIQVIANSKTSLADIRAGEFVGSAADKGPDGKLHAEEVHIFPEAMRGSGEGHTRMRPNPATIKGTVGSVDDPEARTMTNGTVSSITGSSIRTLKIEYKGGVQEIDVAPNVPIITLVLGDSSLLKPGVGVSIVAAQKDGGLVATNITAEKDDAKPQ